MSGSSSSTSSSASSSSSSGVATFFRRSRYAAAGSSSTSSSSTAPTPAPAPSASAPSSRSSSSARRARRSFTSLRLAARFPSRRRTEAETSTGAPRRRALRSCASSRSFSISSAIMSSNGLLLGWLYIPPPAFTMSHSDPAVESSESSSTRGRPGPRRLFCDAGSKERSEGGRNSRGMSLSVAARAFSICSPGAAPPVSARHARAAASAGRPRGPDGVVCTLKD
jgi:hypothetical protein